MYIDKIKNTIMYMIEKKLNIKVTDTPIDTKNDSKNIQYKLLFKSYVDNDIKKIQLIDYNEYNDYLKEIIPEIVSLDIENSCLEFNGVEYKIKSYENGVFTLYDNLDKLDSYYDILFLKLKGENISKNIDFIFVNSPYNYSDRLDYNTLIMYRRFNLNIFVYNDKNNNMIDYYTNELGDLFSRDFFLLDENYEKTNIMIHIQNELNFDMSEYNISNKIIRGSILLKYYKKRSDK